MSSILLVEDEELLRNSLEAFLGSKGFDVTVAEDEHGALELIKNNRFNIVVADIYLGDGSGFGLMKYIQDSCPEVKCIAITGHASLDSAITALRKGVCDYLLKPFGYPELVQSIQKALKAQEDEGQTTKLDFDSFAKVHGITRKEIMLVRHIVTEGLSNDDLADKLEISKNTVKVHLRNIFKKVGVESKTALASKFLSFNKQ